MMRTAALLGLATLCSAAPTPVDVRIRGCVGALPGTALGDALTPPTAMWGGGYGKLVGAHQQLRDAAGATYVEVPPLQPGTVVDMTAASGGMCGTAFFVAVYACDADTGCANGVHGGLAVKLAADGWTRHTRAAQFTLGTTGPYAHGVQVYGKAAAPGETLSTPQLDADAYYTAVFWASACVIDASVPFTHDVSPNPGPSQPACVDHCPPAPMAPSVCINNKIAQVGSLCMAAGSNGCVAANPSDWTDGATPQNTCCVCGAGTSTELPASVDGRVEVTLEQQAWRVVRAPMGTIRAGFYDSSDDRVYDVLVLQARNCVLTVREMNLAAPEGKCGDERFVVKGALPADGSGEKQWRQVMCGSTPPPPIVVEGDLTQVVFRNVRPQKDEGVVVDFACEAL